MTLYRTEVRYLPPTPLGLLPGRWTTAHVCTNCHERVPADQLVAHAQTHDQRPALADHDDEDT